MTFSVSLKINCNIYFLNLIIINGPQALIAKSTLREIQLVKRMPEFYVIMNIIWCQLRSACGRWLAGKKWSRKRINCNVYLKLTYGGYVQIVKANYNYINLHTENNAMWKVSCRWQTQLYRQSQWRIQRAGQGRALPRFIFLHFLAK